MKKTTIVFDTTAYECSTGIKPRGYGLWAYEIGGKVIYSAGTYTQIKKFATKRAKELGYSVVKILG